MGISPMLHPLTILFQQGQRLPAPAGAVLPRGDRGYPAQNAWRTEVVQRSAVERLCGGLVSQCATAQRVPARLKALALMEGTWPVGFILAGIFSYILR